MAMPFHDAESKTVTPGGTRTDLRPGRAGHVEGQVDPAGAVVGGLGDRLGRRGAGAPGASSPSRRRSSVTSRRLPRPPWPGAGRSTPCPSSSWPRSRSAAFTASTISGVRASMIALVRPGGHRHRQERRAELRAATGMPKDTLEAPQVMFRPQVSRMPRIVSMVATAVGGVGADRHRQRVDDDVVRARCRTPWSRRRTIFCDQLEALLGLHRDLVVVVGQRDHGGVVLLDQREDLLHPVVLGGDGVDQRPALVDRQPGLERLDDRGVDADRQVGELLDHRDRLGEQLGLVGQGHAHVDVEHVGAALDLGLDVALDRREVPGAQLLLEDPAAGRVDPLADQDEGARRGRAPPPWWPSG